jgi:hypothetical protein
MTGSERLVEMRGGVFVLRRCNRTCHVERSETFRDTIAETVARRAPDPFAVTATGAEAHSRTVAITSAEILHFVQDDSGREHAFGVREVCFRTLAAPAYVSC